MVEIKRIKIKNFRSIVEETIDLTSFNFFVGKNDCGKSNVLKALNLFFNGKTDFNMPFDFSNDYSKFPKRTAKQAREIVISIDFIIPDTYVESGIKTWTKVWRKDGLHSDNLKDIFTRKGNRGQALLSRVVYLYIPAVKSREYFKYLLSEVYNSMTKTADTTLKTINNDYSAQLQELTQDLTENLKDVLNIKSAIQMPKDLNVLFRDLTFSTSDEFVKGINLNQRGDGIKARHIPSILRYIQQNAEANKPKNTISNSYIWGFEEPENGVEYLSCFEMADELYSYRSQCQLLVTTHSPAFYNKNSEQDVTCYYVYKSENGSSKYQTGLCEDELNEHIGFMPLVAPYIQKERERFLTEREAFKSDIKTLEKRLKKEVGKVIIIPEGKTDVKHLRNAFERICNDSTILSRIEFYDFKGKNTLGVSELNKILEKLSHIPVNCIVIGIYDRDEKTYPTNETDEYEYMGNKVYRFSIPPLNNSERKPEDRICIENYYSDAEIGTSTPHGHLYMGKDFNDLGVSNDGDWSFHNFKHNQSISSVSIIDSSNKQLNRIKPTAKIISKDDFAEFVINNPLIFCYDNFNLIFDVVKKIIEIEDKKVEDLI